jgi:hypothetical protein
VCSTVTHSTQASKTKKKVANKHQKQEEKKKSNDETQAAISLARTQRSNLK